MDMQKETSSKLVLTWVIRSFLPNFEHQDCEVIYELLDPSVFESEKRTEQYWSVPERLMDIRWVIDRTWTQEYGSFQQQNDIFHEFIWIEHGLYRIVTTLGKWAGIYSKCLKALDGVSNTAKELHIFWQQNGAFFRECISSNRADEMLSFSENQLIKLYQLSKELSTKTIADTREKDLNRIANHFARYLEKIWKDDIEESLSLRLISETEQQMIVQLAKEFVEKTIDYFNNPIWRKDSQPIKKLKELMKNIKQAMPQWNVVDAVEWSAEYTESIWNGLQELAHFICQKINKRSGEEPPSITEMRSRVTDVMETLGLSGNAKKRLKEYSQDRGRCIALMELDNGFRLMAFSGYWDCQDTEVREKLHSCYDPDIVDAFRLISAGFGADFVVFSDAIVDRIMRYAPESGCILKERGPLRQELRLTSTESGLSFIRRSYSCCERKILSELELQNKKSPKAAILRVKFAPCLSCFGALQNWVESGKIQFTLDYPEY